MVGGMAGDEGGRKFRVTNSRVGDLRNGPGWLHALGVMALQFAQLIESEASANSDLPVEAAGEWRWSSLPHLTPRSQLRKWDFDTAVKIHAVSRF